MPFRPNTALVFLNVGGAHAVEIPEDAPPFLLRYAYQFYIGPEPRRFVDFIRTLPNADQENWGKLLNESG